MRSLDVAAAVLKSVADRQPAGVSELARALALPKSTVQRVLFALRDIGWLAAGEGQPTRWVLTSAIAMIGAQYRPEQELRTVAPAVMARLSEQVEETVHLAVPDGRFVVLIDRVESKGPVRTSGTLGGRAPAHATAGGLAVLAALPEAEVGALFANIQLERLTDDTIGDEAALFDRLVQVRAAGFASVVGTRHPDVAAVGAAVRDRTGRPIAALSVSMPRQRFRSDRLQEWGRLVLEAADECGSSVTTDATPTPSSRSAGPLVG